MTDVCVRLTVIFDQCLSREQQLEGMHAYICMYIYACDACTHVDVCGSVVPKPSRVAAHEHMIILHQKYVCMYAPDL